MSVFLISARRYARDRIKYRTVYYTECRDASPRFSTKARAARMNESFANEVAAQLRVIAPNTTFEVVAADSKPSRKKGEHKRPPAPPVQMEVAHE